MRSASALPAPAGLANVGNVGGRGRSQAGPEVGCADIAAPGGQVFGFMSDLSSPWCRLAGWVSFLVEMVRVNRRWWVPVPVWLQVASSLGQ